MKSKRQSRLVVGSSGLEPHVDLKLALVAKWCWAITTTCLRRIQCISAKYFSIDMAAQELLILRHALPWGLMEWQWIWESSTHCPR